MKIILTSPFDPVSEREMEYIRQYRKTHGLRDIWLSVDEKGTIAHDIRVALLKKAAAYDRRLHICETSETGEAIEPLDEDTIRKGLYRLAAKGIRKDLITEGYYLDETAKAMCNPHRYAHSKSVAQTAVKLAHAHHLDEKKAYVMGMLHDITKAFSDEQNEQIIRLYKPEWLSLSPKVWHSYTAVIFAKQNMSLTEGDIAYAMEHHTIGDGNTDYAALLYIADKIEPLRGYDVSKQTASAMKNLKKAAFEIREESKAYILKTEGIHV